jgi:hypothetical protein
MAKKMNPNPPVKLPGSYHVPRDPQRTILAPADMASGFTPPPAKPTKPTDPARD